MNLWQGILWYTVKYLFLLLVAFAAIKLGIYLRKKRNDKIAQERGNSNEEL